MANHRMSMVLRRSHGRAVADTSVFFSPIRVSFAQPLLELDPEKMQSYELFMENQRIPVLPTRQIRLMLSFLLLYFHVCFIYLEYC